MANSEEASTPVNKVPGHGDHDRVVMLSLYGDGTPAQVAPEFIGDKAGAIEATKEQFKQQAVRRRMSSCVVFRATPTASGTTWS
jgi:hypothetical protein